MAKRIVRIVRTWDVEVTAEYGDDDQSLMAKAAAGTVAAAIESRNLLEQEG